MRISVPVGAFGLSKAKFIVAALAVTLLSGCSDSIERFASNYNNPSDFDPVYTSSVPKYKKTAPRPITQKFAAQRQYVAPSEEVILQSPIAKAPIAKTKALAYDYSQRYKNTQQPKLAYNAVTSAPAYHAPTYKQPVFAAPVDEADADPVNAPTIAKPHFIYKQVAAAPAIAPTAPAPSTTTITVGNGMTLYGIARANHLTVQQLAAANHLATPYSVTPGQKLKIPGTHIAAMPKMAQPTAQTNPASLVAEEQAQAPAAKPIKAGGAHTVASGDTLYSLGRQYGVAPFAIADLNRLPHNKALSLGQSLRIPSGAKAMVAQAAPIKPTDTGDTSIDTPEQKTAVAETPVKKPAALALPKDPAVEQTAQAAPATADTTALALRWPLKGKVISGFGAKPNGLKNEGINIAVPEGTNIQAAEGGVVAYAGNELKGYGNLILVRHPGGYVTAYAHASQLLVKRGDTVKRGDVIAKAGQTGAVQSPQLHFEVRKGATALDPNKFLTSSTASN